MKTIKRILGALLIISLVAWWAYDTYIEAYAEFGGHAIWITPLTMALYVAFLLLVIWLFHWLFD